LKNPLPINEHINFNGIANYFVNRINLVCLGIDICDLEAPWP
jgi:hypothetical protein